jgi:two-component system sensor histidine kinase UhpB
VVNHANASTLKVKLGFEAEKVRLAIQDDGRGFDAGEINKNSHFGLTGIKERAELIGGRLNIASQPGEGTTIELTI